MPRRLPYALAVLGALVFVTPSAAQEAEMAHKCPEEAAPLPVELSPWTAPAPATAATTPEGSEKAEIKVGAAVKAALSHTPDVHYVTRPVKPGGSVAYGGLFRIAIAEPGTYRVALGNASWVDIVKDGEKAESIHHGGGPTCSGIRKMVDYTLAKGEYFIQLSAGGDPETGLLVVKLP